MLLFSDPCNDSSVIHRYIRLYCRHGIQCMHEDMGTVLVFTLNLFQPKGGMTGSISNLGLRLLEVAECEIIWQNLLALSMIIFQTIHSLDKEVTIERNYNFLTFPACFSIPIIFSNFDFNCSNLSSLRNLQE